MKVKIFEEQKLIQDILGFSRATLQNRLAEKQRKNKYDSRTFTKVEQKERFVWNKDMELQVLSFKTLKVELINLQNRFA